MKKNSTLPGLRGADHIGITVPDLEEATRFFVDVLGFEPYFDKGPFSSSGTWMQDELDVHPRAVMRKLRLFRCGHGSNIEVFEYEAPGQRTTPPRNSDIGGHHIALFVDDIDAAVEHLRSHNVRVLGEPKRVPPSDPNGGMRWVYFKSPWGMQFELVSYAKDEKPYERHLTRKLWNPCHPAD
ncbi:MAG: VOC family protein [Ottowia sp.]|uniref:VOC family protein n=1 Tax=Ottowia sp. TaxID=1898956 RepID=UPI0039E637FA